MSNYNNCGFEGNLTRDPELETKNDKSICKFSIANNDHKGEASFLDCVAFGQTAEFVSKYFVKGKSIIIEARYKQDRWTDKTTGDNRSKPTFLVNRAFFAGSGKADNGGAKDEMPNFT
jgi:single-strand DNA-binding protein